MSTDIRVGLGFDLHRLVEGRPCILGGVLFDHPTGPSGHSDGDAVLHAISDAVLGAAGLDDLGSLFPDTDAAWKDADSAALLGECMRRVTEAGWRPINLDVVIATEGPRAAPGRPAGTHRRARRARSERGQHQGQDPRGHGRPGRWSRGGGSGGGPARAVGARVGNPGIGLSPTGLPGVLRGGEVDTPTCLDHAPTRASISNHLAPGCPCCDRFW